MYYTYILLLYYIINEFKIRRENVYRPKCSNNIFIKSVKSTDRRRDNN